VYSLPSSSLFLPAAARAEQGDRPRGKECTLAGDRGDRNIRTVCTCHRQDGVAQGHAVRTQDQAGLGQALRQHGLV